MSCALSVDRRKVRGVCDYCKATEMRDALTALGLSPVLVAQFKQMHPTDSLPLMRQLVDAEPTVIRRLNAAGLALTDA